MNRYPLWKNLMIGFVLILGLLYTLPNFYGQLPAIQIAPARSSAEVNEALNKQVLDVLKAQNIEQDGIFPDGTGIRVRLTSRGAQGDLPSKARDAIDDALNPDKTNPSFTVAQNDISATPRWLTRLHAMPMYLGLDLRGGLHFLLQVDMKGAITKNLDTSVGDLRVLLKNKDIRTNGIDRDESTLVLRFQDETVRTKAKVVLAANRPDFQLIERTEGQDFLLVASVTELAQMSIKENAIKQNITTLHNRINELGVAEPIIQQQGADRIVVELPGIQDVAKAKDLIGRTATLEVRAVDEDAMLAGKSLGGDTFMESAGGRTGPVYTKRQVVLTGDRFVSAMPGTDSQNGTPIVSVRLDSIGGEAMKNYTRENVGKRMAIILIEKGHGEVISAATIQSEFSNQFQISGRFTAEETARLSLLIRAGSLAAPMEIIEERSVGPSLGAENIKKGVDSVIWGFVAIAVFMCCYYVLFGMVSTISLAANLLLLVGALSLVQATLTLPGMAAIALTLGMAIDANVLINERIREELRAGVSPQMAINQGYERAFATILDSNVTTFIAGAALYLFGTGPVKSFAVVHCLGILTSMFSAVLVSRMLVNFIYGYRRKIQSVAIGQIWKPSV